MSYCSKCGSKLIMKKVEHEGMIPFCPTCNEVRFPMYNSAISCIVLNPNKDKILLIQQYGKPNNILVAGYINHGESGEHALVRELKEELGREVVSYNFLKSEYFEKTNTLLWNFEVVIDSEDLSQVSTWEIDQAQWFSLTDARKVIKENSLAQEFLENYLTNYRHI